MSKLRQLLKESCKIIKLSTEVDYVVGGPLKTFITTRLSGRRAFTFSRLLTLIKHRTTSKLKPPKDPSTLFRACEELNWCGQITFLENEERPKENWIVCDDDQAILSKMHGQLLKCLKQPNHPGIVSFKKLQNLVQDTDTKLDPECVIRYMLRMEICSKVDSQALQLITGLHLLSSEDRYFFFPSLVSNERCSEAWSKKTRAKFSYSFGWCIKCTEPLHFFTPRFQLLLTSLTCKFALVPQQASKMLLEPADVGCMLWKNGIRWLDGDGIETVVDIIEKSVMVHVVVMMRCCKDSEIRCVKLRSSVIQQVLNVKNRVCSEVMPKEYLIHPHFLQDYPTVSTPLIPLSKLTRKIVQMQPYIPLDQSHAHTRDYPHFLIEELFFYEPYENFGLDLLKELHWQHEDDTLSEDTFHRLTTAIQKSRKWRVLADVLHVPQTVITECEIGTFGTSNAEKCLHIVSYLSRSRAALCQHLDQYSIFTGRNPLDLCPELLCGPNSASTTSQSTHITDPVALSNGDGEVSDTPLGFDDHYEVTGYLLKLPKTQMCDLGRAMGLSYFKLQRMMDSPLFYDEVVAAWLQREDDVEKRAGLPSWRSLVRALREQRVGQNGIAGMISRDKRV